MTQVLQGRTALVTGGGKGVGAGISRQLAAAGASVVLGYRSNPDLAIETEAAIRAEGGHALAFQADVGVRAQVDAMVSAAVDTFGGLDILVNNAAWQPNLDIDEYTEAFYDDIMNINLRGYFRCMQAALPHLKKSPCPRIINISSVHAKRPTDFDVGYAMTKGAMTMLTREAAVEFAPYGITVNAVLPGAIQIDFKSGYTTPMKRKPVERERKYPFCPLARPGQPSEIGSLVAFLASDGSSYLTGSSIRADGGAVLT